MQKRNQKATEMSKGMVKFDYTQSAPSIDFCEVCIHPKGRTISIYEMCASFDDINIPELIKDFEGRGGAYFEREKDKNSQLILSLVIPADPGMIMKLGEKLDEIINKSEIAITVYDPKTDKRGSCVLSKEFFSSLREDEDYEKMEDAEIFTNFLMNFVEML
ncbi:MAG: hypothetical protein V3R86_03035, partial [Candidatus Hydrothermarchaeaceae archaeon]